MSALPSRATLAGSPSRATLQSLLLSIYDVVAQRLAAGTSGAGTASAAELLLARNSLGLGAGADIASASTVDFTARTGNLFKVTGTTEIDTATMSDGDDFTFVAEGALPINLTGVLVYQCSPGDRVNLVQVDGVQYGNVKRVGGNAIGDVGNVILVAGDAAPTGSLKLNGAEISRATYATLWAFANASGNIEADDATWSTNNSTNGTNGKFSPGNGSTTFRVPNVRGDFFRAWADGSSVNSGRAIGSYQADAFQGHHHDIYILPGASSTGPNTDNYGGGAATTLATNNNRVRDPKTDGVNGTPRTASETRPRSTAYLACIKF